MYNFDKVEEESNIRFDLEFEIYRIFLFYSVYYRIDNNRID